MDSFIFSHQDAKVDALGVLAALELAGKEIATTRIMNQQLTTPLLTQLGWLLILAIPIACVAWTVTHEQIFFEPREYCRKKSINATSLLTRKFFYLFTCEYCFSFYVTAFFLVITNYQLLFENWRGYLIAQFALVWIANIYMSLFLLIRTDIKKEGTETKINEEQLKK